jgi:hypothetical protein
MLPRLAAVVENFGVVAASVFEHLGQLREAVEDAVVVDSLG